MFYSRAATLVNLVAIALLAYVLVVPSLAQTSSNTKVTYMSITKQSSCTSAQVYDTARLMCVNCPVNSTQADRMHILLFVVLVVVLVYLFSSKTIAIDISSVQLPLQRQLLLDVEQRRRAHHLRALSERSDPVARRLHVRLLRRDVSELPAGHLPHRHGHQRRLSLQHDEHVRELQRDECDRLGRPLVPVVQAADLREQRVHTAQRGNVQRLLATRRHPHRLPDRRCQHAQRLQRLLRLVDKRQLVLPRRLLGEHLRRVLGLDASKRDRLPGTGQPLRAQLVHVVAGGLVLLVHQS